MMRIATIEVGRGTQAAVEALRKDFARAWKTRRYRSERFGFESPAALFRTLTPKRWELIEALQAAGPLTQRALARALARDVKNVHSDAVALLDVGLIEKTEDGKLIVPFDEIRAGFVLKSAA
ncbi:MAG: transcriptional regulator [Rhodocyclaceae bacterium UTPRO2]|nr:MAG: transcriptional regulator [Rhodocyclaceae bacterium UTPRO2]